MPFEKELRPTLGRIPFRRLASHKVPPTTMYYVCDCVQCTAGPRAAGKQLHAQGDQTDHSARRRDFVDSDLESALEIVRSQSALWAKLRWVFKLKIRLVF